MSAISLALATEQLSQGNKIILVPVTLFLIWAILIIAAAIRAFRDYLNYKNEKP